MCICELDVARLQSNHAVKGPTWLKPVHYILKLTLKLASKARVKQLINVPPVLCVCLFSVLMGHKESLGMRLCPRAIFIFDVSLCLCTLHECDK